MGIKPRLAHPGQVFAIPLGDGKWCPLVVVVCTRANVMMSRPLDVCFDHPPTLEEVIGAPKMPVLYTFIHAYHGVKNGTWKLIGDLPDFDLEDWLVTHVFERHVWAISRLNLRTLDTDEYETYLPEWTYPELPTYRLCGHVSVEQKLAKHFQGIPLPRD